MHPRPQVKWLIHTTVICECWDGLCVDYVNQSRHSIKESQAYGYTFLSPHNCFTSFINPLSNTLAILLKLPGSKQVTSLSLPFSWLRFDIKSDHNVVLTQGIAIEIAAMCMVNRKGSMCCHKSKSANSLSSQLMLIRCFSSCGYNNCTLWYMYAAKAKSNFRHHFNENILSCNILATPAIDNITFMDREGSTAGTFAL